MPEQRKKMKCSECGVEMNYHADKLDFTAGLEDPNAIDPDFGGIMEECHACPECGKTVTCRVT